MKKTLIFVAIVFSFIIIIFYFDGTMGCKKDNNREVTIPVQTTVQSDNFGNKTFFKNIVESTIPKKYLTMSDTLKITITIHTNLGSRR
jgi:hypothetical protein